LDSSSAKDLGLSTPGSTSLSAKNYVSAVSSASDQQISSGIAAKAESTGGRGLGDTTIGVLYEAYHVDPVYFSIGGGVRLPTGNRNLSGTEMATTRAAYEAGVRTNLDLLPLDVVMLSWQNQSEVGILGTKHKVGDIDVSTKRVGVRNVGFFYVKPSLGAVADSLDGIKTQFGFSYDYDSALRTTMNDVETTDARSQQVWMYAGVGYSLLNAGIPAQFDVEYEKPYMGKNLTASYSKLTATVKAFAKF
jgi:hypothetical protein